MCFLLNLLYFLKYVNLNTPIEKLLLIPLKTSNERIDSMNYYNEIRNELIMNIAKMFNRYEKYIKPGNEKRLLDILQSNNNVILYEIDDRDINLPTDLF